MSIATYEGGCHCGAVRYRANVDLDKTMACNCSHCQIKGLILSATDADQLTQVKGQDALTEYQFYKHRIRHLFCKTCGVQSFAFGNGPDGKALAVVNVRTIDGVDLSALTPQPIDGKQF